MQVRCQHRSRAGLSTPKVSTQFSVRCAATSVSSSSGKLASEPKNVVSTKALREWCAIIGAIGKGEQMVLLRKGGIDEKAFAVESRDFLLFPSAFHADPGMLKPGVAERYKEEMALDPKQAKALQLGVYARVTGAWATKDPAVVSVVDPLHIGTPAFLEARIKWRAGAPLTVLELQAWRLQQPLSVEVKPDYFGCFSWVDLSGEDGVRGLSLEGAQPCVPEPEFKMRQATLREAMEKLKAVELQL